MFCFNRKIKFFYLYQTFSDDPRSAAHRDCTETECAERSEQSKVTERAPCLFIAVVVLVTEPRRIVGGAAEFHQRRPHFAARDRRRRLNERRSMFNRRALEGRVLVVEFDVNRQTPGTGDE
jgi:hypothetical protein